MNYLLDTHTFLWALFDPDLLSGRADKLIRNPENTIYVSVVSFWEISLKYAIGKLELTDVLPDVLPEMAGEMGMEILALDAPDVATFYRLPRIGHKDPFDRLIIWKAIQHKMTLISKDTKFREYREIGLKCIW